MAASMEPYGVWLTEKLISLNPDTDTDVFVSYITGILDEDSTEEEKKESLLDLLGQVVDDGQDMVCCELLKKWEEFHHVVVQKSDQNHTGELTDHLVQMMEKHNIGTVKTREKTAEELEHKQAILAQYGHVSSGEEDEGSDDEEEADFNGGQGDLLEMKNVNAELVKKHEQELREKARLEAEKKREKDKQDREKQKEKDKDRKEVEKKRTQKGEKRR